MGGGIIQLVLRGGSTQGLGLRISGFRRLDSCPFFEQTRECNGNIYGPVLQV